MLNKTADMLTGNPHVNYPDITTRLIARFFDGLLNGINGFVNIKDNALHHTFRFRFAHALAIRGPSRSTASCLPTTEYRPRRVSKKPRYGFRLN